MNTDLIGVRLTKNPMTRISTVLRVLRFFRAFRVKASAGLRLTPALGCCPGDSDWPPPLHCVQRQGDNGLFTALPPYRLTAHRLPYLK